MLGTLTTIEKIMQEHEVIQAQIKMLSSSVDNLLVLTNLQTGMEFSSYQMNFLSEKRVNIKRAVISLIEGLKHHNISEEEVMQPLIGEPLFLFLKKCHQDSLGRLAEIDWILLNVSPQGILFNGSYLKEKIDTLCQTLSTHCVEEDSILEMLTKLSKS